MKEGEQLKRFIDNQPKSKISIAQGLGVSKQTLFQYFQSKELAAETKKKLEAFFGKKIFTEDGLSQVVSIDQSAVQVQEKEPLEQAIKNLTEADLINARNIERLIALLEQKIAGGESLLPIPGQSGTIPIGKSTVNKK